MTSNVPFEKKQDDVNISRPCDHYTKCTKCKEAERRVKIDCAVEKKLKKCNEFSLGKRSPGSSVG